MASGESDGTDVVSTAGTLEKHERNDTPRFLKLSHINMSNGGNELKKVTAQLNSAC